MGLLKKTSRRNSPGPSAALPGANLIFQLRPAIHLALHHLCSRYPCDPRSLHLDKPAAIRKCLPAKTKNQSPSLRGDQLLVIAPTYQSLPTFASRHSNGVLGDLAIQHLRLVPHRWNRPREFHDLRLHANNSTDYRKASAADSRKRHTSQADWQRVRTWLILGDR